MPLCLRDFLRVQHKALKMATHQVTYPVQQGDSGASVLDLHLCANRIEIAVRSIVRFVLGL